MSYCILTANVLGTCVAIAATDISGDEVMDSWFVLCDVILIWLLAGVTSAYLLFHVIWVSPYSTHPCSPLGQWMTVACATG
eukprot:11726928-Ditylum_brightwellii.AAC.1